MKKAIVIMLTGAMMLAAVACGGGSGSSSTPAAPAEETQTEETEQKEETPEAEVEETTEEEVNIPEDPMTYEEYAAAEVDSEVVIEGAIPLSKSSGREILRIGKKAYPADELFVIALLKSNLACAKTAEISSSIFAR